MPRKGSRTRPEYVDVSCPMCGSVRTVKYWSSVRHPNAKCSACRNKAGGSYIDLTVQRLNNVPLYVVWKSMRRRGGVTSQRSLSDLDKRYYRDRGIGVCQEWASSYAAFREWAVANGYEHGLTIDRIDNGRGYEPENCRWVTHRENCRNTRRSKLTAEKVSEIKARMLLGEQNRPLADAFGVCMETIQSIRRGGRWADVEWPRVVPA